MTPLTTPTETLVRIPFSGLTDFQPLALAPGLPMLDVNKLTYQVLLGWFGDLLGEPELDDDGVAFHAQHNGHRQIITSRALATREDLDGPLQPEFERLKKSLFDVRPVSPSERLIFNRLQPPIGNHDGFLYRVQTESGNEQLVWCWGFQRRTQYGNARLCTNVECSMLFLHDELAETLCPHCGASFAAVSGDEPCSRSRLPLAKASVAALVVMSGGALWLGSHFSSLSADTDHEIADAVASESAALAEGKAAPYEEAGARPGLDEARLVDSGRTGESADTEGAGQEVVTSDRADPEADRLENQAPELLVPFSNLPVAGTPDIDEGKDAEGSAETGPVDDVPSVVSLPDLPEVAQPLTTKVDPVSPLDELPVVESDAFPQPDSDSDASLPAVLPEPVVTEKKASGADSKSPTEPLVERPESVSDSELVARPTTPAPVVSDSLEPPTLTDPLETLTVRTEDENSEPPSEEKRSEELGWHRDYLTAYREAAEQKRYLLMLFQESTLKGSSLSSSAMFAPSMRPMLEQFSRVELPLDATLPRKTDSEEEEVEQQSDVPELLLEHRSFRHLGVRPGLAIVDLTDPESADYARVVSVIPLPKDGAITDLDLMLALDLPTGSISQRTLLFTIRRTIPDTSLSMREFSSDLIELAHRNCRYMAHAGQLGSFDEDFRQQKVTETFGPQAELKQLLYATEAEATIHDAALQAVESWIQSPESFDVLNGPAQTTGMDMFQDPESGRWYVTCFVVR